MNKNSLLLVTPDFDPKQCLNYHLFLNIGADCFSYCISDPQQRKLLVLYDEQECPSVATRLAEQVEQDIYLQQAFASVDLAVHPQDSTFIPTPLFDTEMLSEYGRYFEHHGKLELGVQAFNSFEFNAVFATPKAIQKILAVQWPGLSARLATTGLILLLRQFEQCTLILDFTVSSFQLLIGHKDALLFHQHYSIDSTDELAYYLLLTCQNLEIVPQQCAVYVCGIIHQGDDRWDFLKSQFKQVDLLRINTGYNLGIIEDMPEQYYQRQLSLLT